MFSSQFQVNTIKRNLFAHESEQHLSLASSSPLHPRSSSYSKSEKGGKNCEKGIDPSTHLDHGGGDVVWWVSQGRWLSVCKLYKAVQTASMPSGCVNDSDIPGSHDSEAVFQECIVVS